MSATLAERGPQGGTARAAAAYQRASGFRSQRQQEAEVFHRVNAALRSARLGEAMARARAAADNERLWITVLDLMRDPASPLPESLRARIISVGLAVQRELKRPEPDFNFMIGINEQVAAGLSG